MGIRKLLMVSFVVAVVIAASLVGPISAAPLAPVNPELVKVFDQLKVDSPDIKTVVRYLWTNPESWYARWKMLEQAKKTIDCTYFIIDQDIFGQAFLGHLAKKAREGVKVRLMCDWRIAHSAYMKGMIDKMQELASLPNVEIRLYNSAIKSLTSVFTDFKKVMASNHDKLLIVDGELSMTGGKNIGADYFGDRGENDIIYRDSDILMLGKHAAGQMKRAFDEEWGCLKNTVVKADRINLKDQMYVLNLAYLSMNRYLLGMGLFKPEQVQDPKYAKKLHEINAELSKFKGITAYAGFDLFHGERAKPVKIIDKHSRLGGTNDITTALVRFIDASKHEILIQNPYVVLTETAEAALKRASDRGVKIVIHSNSGGSTDCVQPQAFLMNDWKRLLKEMPNLRLIVAKSADDRLHSKVFVFDSQITIIGSYNMDPLSEQIISECVACVNDQQFGTMTNLRIKNDMKGALEYKIAIEPDGKVRAVFGPEDHCSPEILKKMNFYRKIQWLRPLI